MWALVNGGQRQLAHLSSQFKPLRLGGIDLHRRLKRAGGDHGDVLQDHSGDPSPLLGPRQPDVDLVARGDGPGGSEAVPPGNSDPDRKRAYPVVRVRQQARRILGLRDAA